MVEATFCIAETYGGGGGMIVAEGVGSSESVGRIDEDGVKTLVSDFEDVSVGRSEADGDLRRDCVSF